jgi:hypothetical protein
MSLTRNDGRENSQPRYRPTRDVNRTIRFRPVQRSIVPVRHVVWIFGF